MHGHAMQREHARLHRSLAVLRPPRRFQLLLLLLSGVDRSVSQLARAVRLSQSCTTRHLQSLERAGLVKGLRDGKRVVFRPAPRDAAARDVLESLARSSEQVVLEAGLAAGAISIASAAELEPLMAERKPRPLRRRPTPRSPGDRAADPLDAAVRSGAALHVAAVPDAYSPEPEPAETPAKQAEPESGKTSGAHGSYRRHESDIEDYLL